MTGEGALPSTLRGRSLVGGQATGRIIGGSLTATGREHRFAVGTRYPRRHLVDRGCRRATPIGSIACCKQLRAAGKFEKLAAVGVGIFESCIDERYPQPDVDTVIENALRPLGVPIVSHLPFGSRQGELRVANGRARYHRRHERRVAVARAGGRFVVRQRGVGSS